ncbi:MAG: leucyl aminopeptidase [Edaphobacter sp.]|uniref:leucyl aminopeptidase n=1 Tax=Edaphobacter sp. TaxID=1934404 RepID=UPI0023A3AFDF|nr:leucyl aminopeptidase [Edaphobacter sp.]MDE1177400.1 leucyl aminopeptidase [Edaphobacter sp.]
METKLLFQDAAGLATPLLAVFAVDVSIGKDADPLVALLTTSDAVSNAAASVLATGEFQATLGEQLLLHKPDGLKAERLLVVGLGKAKALSVDGVRKAAGTAVRAAKPRGVREMAIAFPEDHALDDEHLENLPPTLLSRSILEGALVAELDWDTYRSDRKDRSVDALTLVAREVEETTKKEIQLGFDEGRVVGDAQNFARLLVNEPGNVLTPTELGKRAKAMCTEAGLKCEVYSTEKLLELGMGAFHAVAKGSAEPPALIVMTYEPKLEKGKTLAKDAPVMGLVGKGITFDTGGISIKSADGMEKMKYDMAGAAAMIGAMRAIAALKPAVKVISVVCSAENMPSATAYKPGDVLKAMSGKTIEVLNTDAEGRLVLADGLHYAKTLGCTHLINAATLTGACVVALGMINAGVFSNDEDAYAKFDGALKISGEKFWRLPCTDDYKDVIKSQIADIMNTGGSRWGGAISAAMFLKEFAGDTPWIHLDIAGCAWNEEVKPWQTKGPSGVAVRSIVEWVRSFA